jgi:hypothetical protein
MGTRKRTGTGIMGFWGRLGSMAMALALLGPAALSNHARAEPKTLREQIVGTWILVSAIDVRKDGTKVNRWGANPKGTFIFTAEGRYAQMILRTDVRVFGARNAASFGTYTINEREKLIVTKVEASSNHNYSGTERRRVIVSLTDDEMVYINPSTSSGTSVRAVWKRAR